MKDNKHAEYYAALINRNADYEGIFYVGVKTTAVFCRPTCSARKPKFDHCEFFSTAQDALLAGYRPCKRCQPLSHPNQVSPLIQTLVKAVEAHPEKRWKDSDFQQLSIDATTARRQFKKRFGMTFVAYARARRLGIAMKQIRDGDSIINTQVSIGYESGSGLRDAFSRLIGTAPSKSGNAFIVYASWLDTKLGPMLAISSDSALYLLEFVDRRGLEREVEHLKRKTKAILLPGKPSPILSIEKELTDYFNGHLKNFKTKVFLSGSAFQQKVWKELRKIPYGETRSYSDIAKSIGQPSAYRAVARANGANPLAIIIPCHRVINENGELGGYGGGIVRKEWLIHLEKSRV
ncbi:bifunctional transcriptional activator/DNA repair protein Ada [Legionella israelensis]|uniref:bifunctional transcriptional activator/DNA repair enzyme AdaA n=1 Tax=Legionella israelensis TaxID=454 RepID=UPI00117F1BBE|nr:trifunctional transcriptional activator/DNA repair protein Ada/methylated-DNA--[protein]-cysteine S-methyltransferase [Legionella israelensis]QDP73327.1 bifunctional transcriptional activator/DNA repair protein Ada [Legionella israelensis]